MKALEIVLAVLLSLVSLALIAIVTLQSGKEAGLSVRWQQRQLSVQVQDREPG